MQKNIVYEGNKRALFATIFLIVILFSASYAYYTSANSASVKYNLTVKPALEITYLLTAGSTLDFTVNPTPLFQGSSTQYLDKTVATDYVKLDNASSTASITCRYEIWYTPKTKFVNSSTNTSNITEFSLLGTESTGTNSFEFDLSKATSGVSVTSTPFTITDTNASGAVTQTWTFYLRHYNIGVNQNEQMGKSYGGVITFVPLSCS